MKVCKKCKKQVANKTKICKYCGADVSKSKIIKKETPKQKNIEPKQEITKEEKIIENITVEQENKKIQEESKKQIKTTKNNKKDKVKQKDKSKKKSNKKSNKENKKTIKINIEDKIKNKKIKNIFQKFKKVNKKRLITIIILLIIGISLTITLTKIYCYINNTENTVIPNKKNQNTTFDINERITYKDVEYKVTKVETSAGTKLKRPKTGNEFVIVTLKIENKSDTKIKYSYQNWKMNNSLDEEKSRIFAPVNATTALYTGNLVIGGTKTGSMVFEQPIGDDKLRLNFYELEEKKEEPSKEQNKEQEEKEKQKPIFTIIIPKLSEKEEIKQEAQKQ